MLGGTWYHLNPAEFWNLFGGKAIIFEWIMDNGGVNDLLTRMAEKNEIIRSHEVTCATKAGGVVTSLGGKCPPPRNAFSWKLATNKVVGLIENGVSFCVGPQMKNQIVIAVPYWAGGSITVEVPVVSAPNELVIGTSGAGTPLLKARSDSIEPTSLLALPACP